MKKIILVLVMVVVSVFSEQKSYIGVNTETMKGYEAELKFDIEELEYAIAESDTVNWGHEHLLEELRYQKIVITHLIDARTGWNSLELYQ